MIRSMTGYGRGECTLYNRKFVVEIKSVNHRYNDINIKIPRIMNSFEDEIRKAISKEIQRGKTDVYISYETLSKEDVKIKLNEALADAYVAELEKITDRYELCDKVSLPLIAKFPDVISIDRNVDDDTILAEMKEALEIAVQNALTHIISMRSKEGEALKADILVKLDLMKSIADKIKERSPLISADYAQRLKQKVEDALQDTNYDEARLITEITIFTDRSCIDEELTRLDSHFIQLSQILTQPSPVGRKLDFLVQEMNRETNTIGSKSNDIEITQAVIELKSEIEKIREQIQNIE